MSGTDLVPVPRRDPSLLETAADAGLGVAARGGRLVVAAGRAGFGVARLAGRLPGAAGAARAAESAARPLVADGRAARERSRSLTQAVVQRVLDEVVPLVVEELDVDDIVRRIDVDDVARRINVESVVERVDVNGIVDRLDIDQIVADTELGTIVARSTSGFASEALDAARGQTAGLDVFLSGVVNRVLRRRSTPAGPPLLVSDE